MRRALGLVAAAILAGACSTGAEAPAGSVVLRLEATTSGASAALAVGEELRDGIPGRTCWRPVLADPEVCRDDLPTALPEPIAVPRGAPILIEGRPVAMTAHWLEPAETPEDLLTVPQVEPIVFRDGRAVVGIPPGRYTLSIFARWQRGDAAFYFAVVVA
jgi:hypothetical protein